MGILDIDNTLCWLAATQLIVKTCSKLLTCTLRFDIHVIVISLDFQAKNTPIWMLHLHLRCLITISCSNRMVRKFISSSGPQACVVWVYP